MLYSLIVYKEQVYSLFKYITYHETGILMASAESHGLAYTLLTYISATSFKPLRKLQVAYIADSGASTYRPYTVKV